MSKITITTKEIKSLQKNPNVQHVSSLAITYTDDFKNKFMDKYMAGNKSCSKYTKKVRIE